MAGDVDDAAEHVDEIETIREEASTDGIQAYILGEATSTEDFKKISEEDLRFGESIGVVAAIIVLIVVFGALIAGVTPIIMAIFAISVTLGIVAVIGQLWKFTFFAPNLISMMGLAVGIDYSLFIVSRYREERRKGGDKLRAIGRSGATANRAVFFSGLTVVIALSGMLLVPTTIFRGLAGGAIIVVLVSVAASMTLLPAVLSLLGTPAKRVGADWLDWPWMSRTANALALVGHDRRGGGGREDRIRDRSTRWSRRSGGVPGIRRGRRRSDALAAQGVVVDLPAHQARADRAGPAGWLLGPSQPGRHGAPGDQPACSRRAS